MNITNQQFKMLGRVVFTRDFRTLLTVPWAVRLQLDDDNPLFNASILLIICGVCERVSKIVKMDIN